MGRSGEPNPKLYQAVLDAPEDDAPRLAYAGWLEANGDRDRARFIRAGCRLARASSADPEHLRLQHESDELLMRHRKRWLYGRADTALEVWRFERGFPEHVVFSSADAFLEQHPDIFHFRVQRVGFSSLRAFARLAASKLPGAVRELDLSNLLLGEDAVRRLVTSPHLRQLTWLNLANNSLFGTSGGEAVAAADLPHLRHLDLGHGFDVSNSLGPGGGRALAGAPLLARVERMLLGSCSFGDEGLLALAESPHLGQLTELDLRHNVMSGAALAAAVARGAWPRLRALSLMGNPIGDGGAAELAGASHWERLEVLDLTDCGLGDAGVIALAGAPHLRGLRALVLSCNRVTDAGAQALADSPYLGALRDLQLGSNRIGERGGWALGRSTRLPSLRHVGLIGNAISTRLAAALTERFSREDPGALDALAESQAAPVAVPPVPPPLAVAKGTAPERGLLQEIADDPDDDLTLLAYADWLEENGDPEWAELIRLDLQPGGPEDVGRRQELTWAVAARRLAPFARHVQGGSFERGLLRVHVSTRAFLTNAFQANAVGWFEKARVHGLRLSGGTTESWSRIADSPVLAAVRDLELASPVQTLAGLERLLSSRHLAGMNTLRDSTCAHFAQAIQMLTDAPLSRLRRLFLANAGISEWGLGVLLAWPRVARLTTLGLAHNQLRPADAAQLAVSPQLAGLRRLDVGYNMIQGPGAVALVGSSHLAQLADLDLQGCGVEDEDTVAIASSARLGKLAVLNLSNNTIRDDGARALAEARPLAAARLILAECEVSPDCQRQLRQRHGGRVRFV